MSNTVNREKFPPLLIVILPIIVFLVSCNHTRSKTPVNTPQYLVGTPWAVVSVNGTKLDKDTKISLTFLDGGTFRGDVLCNYYGGKYATGDNNTLRMTDVTVTLLLCQGNQAQGDKYLQILSSVLYYKFSGNKLVFQGKDDKELVILQSP